MLCIQICIYSPSSSYFASIVEYDVLLFIRTHLYRCPYTYIPSSHILITLINSHIARVSTTHRSWKSPETNHRRPSNENVMRFVVCVIFCKQKHTKYMYGIIMHTGVIVIRERYRYCYAIEYDLF